MTDSNNIKKIDQLPPSTLKAEEALSAYTLISGIGDEKDTLHKMTFSDFRKMVNEDRRVEGHTHWRVIIDTNFTNAYYGLSEVAFYESGEDDPAWSYTVGSPITGSETAFDADEETAWSTNVPADAHVGYQFVRPVGIIRVEITGPEFTAQAPRTFRIQYSDDGLAWEEAWTVSNEPAWTARETRTFVNSAPVWEDEKNERIQSAALIENNIADGEVTETNWLRGLNVGSVLRTGVGRYTVEFTTPLSSTDFGVNASARLDASFAFEMALVGVDHTNGGMSPESIALVVLDLEGNPVDPLTLSFEIYDPDLQGGAGGGAGSGRSGAQVFVSAHEFTNASHVTIESFAEKEYDVVEIYIELTPSDNASYPTIRMKTNGAYQATDYTYNNYVRASGGSDSVSNSNTGTSAILGTSTGTTWGLSNVAGSGFYATVQLIRPHQTNTRPYGVVRSHYTAASSVSNIHGIGMFGRNVQAAIEGLIISISSGTITGTVTVYGLRRDNGNTDIPVEDATFDGTAKGRLNGNWVDVVEEAPVTGSAYARQDGEWVAQTAPNHGGQLYDFGTLVVRQVSTGAKHGPNPNTTRTHTFPSPTKIGNTILIIAVTHPSITVTPPAGFVRIITNTPFVNQGIMVMTGPADGSVEHSVYMGDGGVSISYEIEGKILTSEFYSQGGLPNSWQFQPHQSRFAPHDLRFVIAEHDYTAAVNLSGGVGFSLDYNGSGVSNHAGSFGRISPDFNGIISGSFTGNSNFAGTLILTGERVPARFATPWTVRANGSGTPQTIEIPEIGLGTSAVNVFVNGLKLRTNEYTIIGHEIHLTTNASGDQVEITRAAATAINAPVAASGRHWRIRGVATADAGWGLANIKFFNRTQELPIMGEPFASQSDAGTEGWTLASAFNGLSVSPNGWFSQNSLGHVGLNFAEPTEVTQIFFQPLATNANSLGKTLAIDYSDDGISWVELQMIDVSGVLPVGATFTIKPFISLPKAPTYYHSVRVNSTNTINYIVSTRDIGTYHRLSHTDPITVTIPTATAYDIPIGAQISFIQAGSGQITVQSIEPMVVRVNSPSSLTTRTRYSGFTLTKVGNNDWDVIGDLEPLP